VVPEEAPILAALARNEMRTKKTKSISNPHIFLSAAGVTGRAAKFRRGERIYSQGDPAATVMYVRSGRVKLSVAKAKRKEVVVAIFRPGDFLGEGCMAGQSRRVGTTQAIEHTTLLIIPKKELLRALHAKHEFADRFITFLLAQNLRTEEKLIGHLFNSTEKQLARTLLLLASYGEQPLPDRVLPKLSPATLSTMAGIPRLRLKFLMNKFRKLGFIEDSPELKVNKSLLTVVLRD
jgi:CRP/FNR family cyclic AMP-dependent transcriptional regulator